MELTTLEVVIGGLAILTSLLVVVAPNPIVSAMALLGTLFLTGGLYFAMGSFFIGAAQILIYAGAIAVLFVFIVMLLDIKPIRVRIPGRAPIVALGITAAVCFLAAGFLATAQSAASLEPVTGIADLFDPMTPVQIARLFVSKYMVAFQMTGFLMLAAIMGAILLGKPEKTSRYG